MKNLSWYLLAALCEIAGCFAFWAWLRQGKSALWIVAGVLSLAVFAAALTRIESENAGRTYATYGGIYIVSSLIWLWLVEGVKPDKWDVLGATICLFGAGIILLAPRS